MNRLTWLPAWWYFLLAGMASGGIALCIFQPSAPQALYALTPRFKGDTFWVLVGILFTSIAVTHLVLFASRQVISKLFELNDDHSRPDVWTPALLGLCESAMYPVSLVMGRGEFIGVWLALKVAGQWVRWGGDTKSVEEQNKGRRRFNRFLIGNALSVIAAVVTYGALKVWAIN